MEVQIQRNENTRDRLWTMLVQESDLNAKLDTLLNSEKDIEMRYLLITWMNGVRSVCIAQVQWRESVTGCPMARCSLQTAASRIRTPNLILLPRHDPFQVWQASWCSSSSSPPRPDLRLTTHLHLVLRMRMRGAIHPPPKTPSWWGA